MAAYEAIGVDSYSSAVLCFAPDIATAFYRAYRSGDKRTMNALLAEAIRALRDAFPDMPLRLDPNCAWSVPVSQRVAEQTAGLLEYLEDPDALARRHEDYLSCGIRERDDTGYYRRFHPEYERLRPRW